MSDRVAEKLRKSLKSGTPFDPDWLGYAISIANREGVTVNEVIWRAVQQLLDEKAVKRQKPSA